jgi:hypothetical protein
MADSPYASTPLSFLKLLPALVVGSLSEDVEIIFWVLLPDQRKTGFLFTSRSVTCFTMYLQ